jgi:probable HAF family extracellular repeat protein
MVLSIGTAVAAETYISFDFPGSTATNADGINADGAVVGWYMDSTGKQHGYLLSAGNFTTIDYPGALSVIARGINDQGDIVGTHIDATGLPGGGSRGYLLRAGAFTDVNVPAHLNTIPQRINNAGQVVGCYHDTDTMGTMHGFLFSDGNYGGLSTPASMHNGLMPDGSVIVGLYTDMMTGLGRGYVSSGGNVAPFDFPFSASTQAWDMNPSGEVVGLYTDAAKKTHGFLLRLGDAVSTFGITPQGGMNGSFGFISIDYPGATFTQAVGINSRGDVVGGYVDSAGKMHGFLLTRGRRHQE